MSELSPSAVAKRKQIAVGVLIILAVIALSTMGVYLTADSGPKPEATRQSDIRTKSYIAPGEKVAPEDAWRGVADNRLTLLENKLSAQESENRELRKKLEQATGKKDVAATAGRDTNASRPPEAMSDDELDKRLKDYEKTVATTKYPDGTPAPKATPAQSAKPAPVAGQVGNNGGKGQQPTQMAQAQGGGLLTVRLSNPNVLVRAQGGQGASVGAVDPKNQPKTTQNYLPSGMFGQAVVLSGLDAPTGGQAQTNPHPVLLQLRDLAVLPNKYRYDWKECRITAAGYGDISSERAYIRTESLSCVSKDGKVLDVPIKGYIAGEDGKAGMRGRLVSKQGQALANALLAGVVSGIGSGLEKSSQIQSTSALGTTTTVKPGDEYKAGIGEGVGKALDRLANYYIALAEKMFPVIEVDAGRVVDIVLTKGVLVDVDVQQQ